MKRLREVLNDLYKHLDSSAAAIIDVSTSTFSWTISLTFSNRRFLFYLISVFYNSLFSWLFKVCFPNFWLLLVVISRNCMNTKLYCSIFIVVYLEILVHSLQFVCNLTNNVLGFLQCIKCVLLVSKDTIVTEEKVFFLLQSAMDIPGLNLSQQEYYPYVYYKIECNLLDLKV